MPRAKSAGLMPGGGMPRDNRARTAFQHEVLADPERGEDPG
jgi:hypothetical protein